MKETDLRKSGPDPHTQIQTHIAHTHTWPLLCPKESVQMIMTQAASTVR